MVINVAYHDTEFGQFVNKFLDGPISLAVGLEVLSLEANLKEVNWETIVKEFLKERLKGTLQGYRPPFERRTCKQFQKGTSLSYLSSFVDSIRCLHDKLVEKLGSIVRFRRYWFYYHSF